MKSFDTDFKESMTPPEAEAEYSLTLEQNMKAFDAYQRIFERSKLIIWTALILLGIVVNAYSFAAGGGRTLHILLIVLLLFIAGTIWTRPARIKKVMINAANEIEEGRYHMELYPDYLRISTVYTEEQLEKIRSEQPDRAEEDIPATIIRLTSGDVRAAESEGQLSVCIKRTNAYAIPKDAFDDEEYARVKDILARAMDERFKAMKS